MAAAVPSRSFTLADYLDVEERSPAVKHELVRGAIFAMAGGTVEHAALSATVVGLLMARLADGPCRAYSSDLRLRIREAEVATYADASVVYDPVERDPESPTHVMNPRVVVEVLSPSTEAYDREEKRGFYQRLASLGDYVLVAQDRRRVEVWSRGADGWVHEIYEAGATARLTSIDCELSVDELYRRAGVDVA